MQHSVSSGQECSHPTLIKVCFPWGTHGEVGFHLVNTCLNKTHLCKTVESVCLSLSPFLQVQECATTPDFLLGIWLRSSCLLGKNFTWWALFQTMFYLCIFNDSIWPGQFSIIEGVVVSFACPPISLTRVLMTTWIQPKHDVLTPSLYFSTGPGVCLSAVYPESTWRVKCIDTWWISASWISELTEWMDEPISQQVLSPVRHAHVSYFQESYFLPPSWIKSQSIYHFS